MIRKAKVNDLEKIVDLELKIFNESLGVSFLLNELKNKDSSNILVYELENTIIGYLSYRFNENKAELLNFLIDSKYQTKGYGTKFFNFFIEDLKKREINSLILEVRSKNLKAISFYKNYNYKLINTFKNHYKDDDALVLLINIKDD
ncbi:MAG: GNAT family N-acetyltransferase [Acholeplasmataceae bacterium]